MRLLCSVVCLAVALSAAAVAAERDVSGGVQKCYLDSVPHLTATGQVLRKFDPRTSFLPLGVWSVYVGKLKELSEAGFNAIAVAGMDKKIVEDPAGRKDLLKQLSANRIQFVPAYMPTAETLRALVGEPTILAYLPIDEPNRFLHSQTEPIDQVFQELIASRRRLRSIDPHRAMWVNLVPRHFLADDPPQTPWWYAFDEAADVASTDCYEIIGPESDVKELARSVADQVEINQDRAPTWFIAQGHKDKRSSPHPDNVLPTTRQYRAEIYTAIVHGATGIFTFKINEESWPMHLGIGPDTRTDWGTPEEREKWAKEGVVVTDQDAAFSRELWNEAAKINKELTSLKKVILSPTSSLDYKIFISDSARDAALPIRTLLKHVDGAFYLLAVNVLSRPFEVRIEMPAKPRGLEVLFGSGPKSASVNGTSIVDSFEPLGMRVYRFKTD